MIKDNFVNIEAENINAENIIFNENNESNWKCILCNRPYDYKYTLFGRSCLDNLYKQLNVSKFGIYFNKENHLLNSIAHRNFKFFLNQTQKQAILENYIALDYLKRMNLTSMESIKEQIENNIKLISAFAEFSVNMFPVYPLNEFYKIYRDYKKFKETLDEAKEKENNKDKYDETILKGFTFIFDKSKLVSPLWYYAYYGMQYSFWKWIVEGGKLKNMELSSYLLNISLTDAKKIDQNETIIIKDDDIKNIFLNNEEFKNILNNLLFEDEINISNYECEFKYGDLFYAIHKADMDVKGNKNNENEWNLHINISDRYDFTDIKGLDDYSNSTDNISKSLLSSTLNNFAAISSQYEVIKPYNFKIEFDIENYSKN